MLSSMSLILTASALVGFELAQDKSLATLPIAVIFVAGMFTSIPAAMLMERIGRKAGFMMATFFGMGGDILATIAILNQAFWWFVASGLLIGMFNGFGNYFRFAAADAVDKDHKSRAISYVLAGGVVAAFIGPNLANLTRNSIADHAFAGSYVSIIVIYVLMFVALYFLRLPDSRHETNEHDKEKRPLVQIVKQPRFVVALLCAMLGYGVMSLLMTATPLAMHHNNHSFSDTSFVIQWHVLGMFAPSFFSGKLIQRYGVTLIMYAGVLLGFACVATNLLGTSVWHYWLALTLLGVSWNFLFVGGTTMLTETYEPQERAKTQAVNDFSIFTTVTITSLIAGTLQHEFGWRTVNLGVMPLLFIILASVIFISIRKDREES